MFTNNTRLVACAAISFTMVACAAQSSDVQGDSASEEIVSKSAHFETFQGLDGQYYFDLVADNGQNVLRSEGYETLAGAKNGVAAVVANGVDAASFRVSEAKDGSYYFDLVAGNNEVIGTSEMYASKSNATRGAKTVRALVLRTGATPSTLPASHTQRFEVFMGEDRQYYFHLRAANGEIVLSSEGYTTKASALDGVASVQANGANAASYVTFQAANGEWGVKLEAANHETIASSELYVSSSNANRAVSSMARILSGKVAIKAD